MLLLLKKLFIILCLLHCNFSFASGGYDNGTPAGKGNLDVEVTINPLSYFGYGQSYVVWGYGLTNKIDFHGYATHPVSGGNQLYMGFMYNFVSNKYVDLSTAFGLRYRVGLINPFFPQLLYTIKLPKKFDVIGSVVVVSGTGEKFNKIASYDVTKNNYKAGVTFDIALRTPLPFKRLPYFIRGIKIAVGAFKGVSNHWYPTYSIDFRFNLHKRT